MDFPSVQRCWKDCAMTVVPEQERRVTEEHGSKERDGLEKKEKPPEKKSARKASREQSMNVTIDEEGHRKGGGRSAEQLGRRADLKGEKEKKCLFFVRKSARTSKNLPARRKTCPDFF